MEFKSSQGLEIYQKVSNNKLPGEKHGRPRNLDSVALDHLRSRVVADIEIF